VERDSVGVENDTQAPLSSEITPHIARQSAYEACTRQYKKTECPLHGKGENRKADHNTGDDREENDAKEGEQSRR
jgi:hypothetical protein